MVSMTPIKVRGKRGAIPAQKWHAGKERTVNRDASPALPTPSASAVPRSSVQVVAASSRKRKRRDPQLSALEHLPVEIIQDIFEYCANLELPFASSTMMGKLSSRHVYMRLTTRILQPVLGFEKGKTASAANLAAATRLFGCHFMTWEFIRAWLDEESPSTEPRQSHDYCTALSELKPSNNLLPPPKLLHGRWTTDKSHLLSMLQLQNSLDLPRLNPVLGELASEGACQAIAEGAHVALDALLAMRVRPNTEMFRLAIIDHGCDRKLVQILYDFACTAVAGDKCVDPLDPALWAWAEKARQKGDKDGEFVLMAMRRLAEELRVHGDLHTPG